MDDHDKGDGHEPAAGHAESGTETFDAHGATMPFMGSIPEPISPGLSTGDKLGRYIVLDHLGAGGMGVVYAAFDPKLDRKVALKLLKYRPTRSSQTTGASSRLLREAQAMARLSHPNVIGVHDVGTIGDQIFVAMEFVDGGTLRQWWNEKPHSWQEVLDLYIRAGSGLAAAHAVGLVHRDFKPDNVMVGKDGRVRVMDFGLAREVAKPPSDEEREAWRAWVETLRSGRGEGLDAPLTRTGTTMGTPAYMAPEQHLRLATDARTDQFSFCVALYEALYGERPFGAQDRAALAIEVTQGRFRDAPPDSKVPSWIRRILLRGLSVAPEQRYPSMDALLLDLRRDPRVRRRRVLFAAGILALLVATAVTVQYLTGRADLVCKGAAQKMTGVWDPARKEAVRSAFLGTRLPYAHDSWRGVNQALERYTGAWVQMRTDACEATRVRGEQSAELLDLRMQCLDRRLAEVRALVELFARPDARVVSEALPAAQALTELAGCANTETLTALVKPPNDPATRAKVKAVRERLATAKAMYDAGKYRDGLRVAAAVAPEARQAGYRPVLAEALFELGRSQGRTGKAKAAAVSLFEAWIAAQASRYDRLGVRAATMLVAVEGYLRARYGEGERWGRVAQATLHRLGGEERLAAYLLTLQGLMFNAQARYALALEYHQRALALYRKTVGETHLQVALVLNNIGLVMRRLGRFPEALRYLRRALAIGEKRLGARHPRVGRFLNNMAVVLVDQGKIRSALKLQRKALAIYEATFGHQHVLVAHALNNLGMNYVELKEYRRALKQYRRALAIYRHIHGPDHPNVAVNLNNIGYALLRAGRLQEARRHLEDALRIWQKRHGPDHPDVALALENLGWLCIKERRPSAALEFFQRAVRIRRKKLGARHPAVAHALFGVGESHLAMKRPRRAVGPLRQALALLVERKAPGADLGQVRFALARALGAVRGSRKEARSLGRAALQAFRKVGAHYRPEERRVRDWLRAHLRK